MMESEIYTGGMVIIAGVLIYHTRLIFQMKTKLDLIYDNIKTVITFKDNNK